MQFQQTEREEGRQTDRKDNKTKSKIKASGISGSRNTIRKL